MNSGPPPLPTSGRSEPAGGFARPASYACLASPLVMVGLAVCITTLNHNHSDPSARLLFIIFGLITVVLFISGVLLGILAMALARPGERLPVMVRAICGLALLGLLVAIAVPNFKRGRAQALRRQQSLRELHTAVNDVRAQAAAALTNGGKTAVDPQALLRSFNQMEKDSTGETAALFQCTQRFIKRELAYQQTYTQAVGALTAAKVLGTSDLVDRTQITNRKAIVQTFLDANSAFKAFLSQSESNFRQELKATGVSDAQSEEALKGFRKNWQPQAPLLIAIREADDRFGRKLLETLDLFDAQWGQWRYDTNAHLVRFENHDAVRQYNALMADIRQTSSDQVAAQKRLAAVLSRPSASF